MNHRVICFSVFMCVSYLHGMNDTQFNTLLDNSLNFFQLTTCAYLEQKKAEQANAPSQDLERSPHAQNNIPMNTYVSHFFPQKKFPCNFGCGKSFNAQHSLREHERNKHSEMAEHKCSTCQKAFFSYQGLCQHIRKKHS